MSRDYRTGEHITNLEGQDRVLQDVASAEKSLAECDKTSEQSYREAIAQHTHATLRADNWKATHTLFQREFGSVTIGKPKATKYRTVKQLESMGLVGIYKA